MRLTLIHPRGFTLLLTYNPNAKKQGSQTAALFFSTFLDFSVSAFLPLLLRLSRSRYKQVCRESRFSIAVVPWAAFPRRWLGFRRSVIFLSDGFYPLQQGLFLWRFLLQKNLQCAVHQ